MVVARDILAARAREAEAAGSRADGLNVIEQRLATARAERDRHVGDLAVYLDAQQTVEDLITTFDASLDAATLGNEIETLQASLREGQRDTSEW